jgi:hypothetical protein
MSSSSSSSNTIILDGEEVIEDVSEAPLSNSNLSPIDFNLFSFYKRYHRKNNSLWICTNCGANFIGGAKKAVNHFLPNNKHPKFKDERVKSCKFITNEMRDAANAKMNSIAPPEKLNTITSRSLNK